MLDSVAGAFARWEVVVGLLLGVVTLLSIVARVTWKATGFLRDIIEAVDRNTRQVRRLAKSVTRLRYEQAQTAHEVQDVRRRIDEIDGGETPQTNGTDDLTGR